VMLGQIVLQECWCTAELAHLDLSLNDIGQDVAESLAGVLAQCTALSHLDLWGNNLLVGIGVVGEGMLRASWCGEASGLFL
jgi:Ran GTPase-activating protein (RanGAP) involved in mRNA processing and transport